MTLDFSSFSTSLVPVDLETLPRRKCVSRPAVHEFTELFEDMVIETPSGKISAHAGDVVVFSEGYVRNMTKELFFRLFDIIL